MNTPRYRNALRQLSGQRMLTDSGLEKAKRAAGGDEAGRASADRAYAAFRRAWLGDPALLSLERH